METVALLYEDYQKELAEDFKNTFLKRASDTDSSRSNDTVIDEVTDMLSTNIAVYTEKLLQRWGFSSGGEGGGGGDVTVTLDDLLKKYLSDNYVTIKGDQEVFGEKDFRKGIRIAGRRLYWDEGNDALVIEGAAYTTRWLSAKGVSPGGGGAGSGGAAAMYQLIDVSPNDTKDAVLGAEKDYVLTFDGSFWRGMPNKGGLSSKLFTALDKEGNEVNPDDENAEIYAIRANYSLWSVGFLSAKGISDGGTGGGGGGAVALYQLLDVEKNADITGVAGATKGSVLTFNGDKWYADKPKTAAGISNLFTALDKDGNEVDLNDESKLGTITNIRANYALWSVDWISAKGKSSGGSGGGGGLINLVYGFESLGGTFDNNDNSATFNAFTINEIWKLASSGLTNVTVTGSGNAVTDVTKGSDGRSLTFTKGSTFATKSEFDALNTKFNDFLTGSDADDIINKWSELEVFLQGMKESDNLAVILQSKMDKTAFSKLFTALDALGNEVDPSDDTKTIASIRANFGFWGVDYISAKGVSKGSGGTGGASTLYQLVDVLANDTEDGVEGAAAGKALVFDGTHWRAGDAGLNESQLYSYLTANKYLTQSAADSRYVTSSRKVIAGTGLSGGGALTSDVTLSLATTGVKAGTYTKVTVDTYGRVTVGDNPTTLAGYGITDAYTKTEADGKYVTIATPQTITGQKTFTKNIAMNSGIGLSYSGNTVFRNTSGNTVISSYGDSGMLYFRPNGDTSDVGVVQINKQGHINGVSAGFKGGVSAARLSATEYVQIGDAYLKWDAANNAVYVIKKDGTTPVGFYSTDWLSAKGVSMSGAQTGTLDSLNDVEITDPVNGQALKYDAASKKWVNGTIDSFNVNQMWAELKKADSSKVIDASHIPTSVLDGRWVKKAGDTMTGTLTSASSSGSIVFKGVENCDITNIYKDNGVIRNDDGGLTSIRNGLRFNWYDTYWYIGNLRGSSTESAGFGVVDHNNKLVLCVTPNDVRAPRFMSTVATGLSPLIVSSNTTVDNLSADLLDGYHAFGTSNALIKYGYTVGGTEPAWCRIATYSIRNTETMTDVCFVLHSSFSDLFGLLVVKTRGTAVVEGLLIASYNINRSNIRIYHDAEKKNIELYCYGGSNYSIIQANLLYSHDRNGGANTNITLYRADTKAPSWSTYVNPGFVNLQNSSEMAKKLQTPRTLWGQSFDGSANVSGNMTGVGSINMSGVLTIANSTYNKQLVIRSTGSTAKNQGEGIWFRCDAAPQEVVLRHEWYDTFVPGYGLAVSKHDSLEAGDANMFFYNTGRFIAKAPQGTSPYQCVSTTLNVNLNADLLDGLHENSFLRHRDTYGIDGYNTLWAQIGIRQYNNAKPDGMTSSPYIYGAVISLPSANARFDIWYNHYSSSAEYGPNGIQYRSGWGDDKKPWRMLLDNVNYASYSDGRYVKKAGDTMTGDLAMDTNKGFYFPHGTRVVKTSGNWIHDGGDTASSTDANLRFGSWNGIGWYPTISGMFVAQGNNAMWLDVRRGALDVFNTIISHHGYLAANWDAARRLVLGGGSSYAWIDLRNSSNNSMLNNIILYDGYTETTKEMRAPYFKSIVGTGKAPYQCNSTTLNTNLNADLLDNWHIMDIPRNYNSTATYSLQFALGGTDNDWKKIFACSESGAGPYRSVTVWGRIWYAYGNHAQDEVRSYHFCAIFQMRSGPSASDSNVGDISNSARLYLPTFAKGMDNIRLVRVGTNNFELQVRQIGSYNNGYIQYQYWANGANVSAWRGLQSTSNTSVAVSAGGASTLADSRASSADVWTTARTFYIQDYHSANTGAGVSVNGGSNCYLKLPSTTRFSRIDFSTPNANIRHSGNDNGNEVGSSTLSNLVIDSWYGVSFTTTCSSTYQNKIAMSVNCRTGRVTANNFHAATNITANGAITAKASSSDIRLKTDIQGYDAMGIIRKFRSVKYHWNAIAKENSEVFNHDNWNYGLIAQDLLSGGYSQWVKDAFNDYYTIDYERLIPVVWKGLQEVDDEVTKLKREVARLNKRVKELEKSLCA